MSERDRESQILAAELQHSSSTLSLVAPGRDYSNWMIYIQSLLLLYSLASVHLLVESVSDLADG